MDTIRVYFPDHALCQTGLVR